MQYFDRKMKEELDKCIIYLVSRYVYCINHFSYFKRSKGDIRIDKQRDLWNRATIAFVEDTHRFQMKKLP